MFMVRGKERWGKEVKKIGGSSKKIIRVVLHTMGDGKRTLRRQVAIRGMR